MPNGHCTEEAQWRGEMGARVDDLEVQVSRQWQRLNEEGQRLSTLELNEARNKGRIEGAQLVIAGIAALLGSMVGALVTWVSGKH